MKIIYAGTPDFAVPALEKLIQSDHQVVSVYTQPDRPAGRGRKLEQSPVKLAALSANIDVHQPESFKDIKEIQILNELGADLMVVAAYGLILPPGVLQEPRLGCLNIHASLLPRWRGAAPIQRAILAGDQETGITIMQMSEGLDTGDMLAKQAITIESFWTSHDLHDALSIIGAELLISALDKYPAGINPEKQDEAQACYAAKLVKSEAVIDWKKSASIILREIRAFCPWPVSFTHCEDRLLRVWRAGIEDDLATEIPGKVISHNKMGVFVGCGNGILRIDELQFAGKNKTDAAQALNALNLTGNYLGSAEY